MGNAKQDYPKQPVDPNRTPEQSVTWVRNLHVVTERIVVVLPPGSKNPVPQPQPKTK